MTTVIDAPVAKDGLYLRATPNTFSVVDTTINMHGGRAGIITDMEPQPAYLAPVMRSVEINVMDGHGHQTLWGIRRHKLRSPLCESIEVTDYTPAEATLQTTWMKEHAFYDEIESGDAVYRNRRAFNIPAQFIQIRLAGNRKDVMWPNRRAILIEKCEGWEVGQLRGAGRAGFAISVKDSGPEGEVVIAGTALETINQRAVKKTSGGVMADSFGAICVEYAKTCLIERCEINYRNPANHAIQLYDFANKAKGKTGPEEIVVQDCTLAPGNNIALRIEASTKRVEVAGCKGQGQIIVYKMNASGIYGVARRIPIASGFKYRA